MEKGLLKRGFTLMELITVIGMLLVMIGAIASAVSGARKLAKKQQAMAEAQEMTNAILAYEGFGEVGKESPLAEKATGEGWKEATESDLAFILGKEAMPNGQDGDVPVLFNAAIVDGKILDPWGRPYLYRIMQGNVNAEDNAQGGSSTTALAIPNINRMAPSEEVQ